MRMDRRRFLPAAAGCGLALFLVLLPPSCAAGAELHWPDPAGEAFLGNAVAGWELRLLPGSAPDRVLLEARSLGPDAWSAPGRPLAPKPLGGAELLLDGRARAFRATAAGVFQLEVDVRRLARVEEAVVRLHERGGDSIWSVAIRPGRAE